MGEGRRMENAAQVVTELRLRREADGLNRPQLIARLQLLCEKPTQLDQWTLRDWEIRAHAPCAMYAGALRRYFGVDSIAKLGLGHEPEAAAHWTWATKAERKREVQRRTLIRLMVMGVGASLLPVGPLTQAAQLVGGRRRIEPEALDAAEQVATHLAATYNASPSGAVIPAAVAHARTLTDRLARASMTPASRTRLAALASDAASLAGYTALHAGHRREGDQWLRDATALAREAGDLRLEALALASTALPCFATYMPIPGGGERSGSLAALQAAAALDRHLPAAGRAWVNAYLARELASAGDDAGSGRALEHAFESAALVGLDEPGWGWWSAHGDLGGWDGARVGAFTAVRSLMLGRHAHAASLFESKLNGVVLPIRRIHLHRDLAVSWAGADEPERACAAVLSGLAEAEANALTAMIDQLRSVRACFPSSWRDLGCVRELDERLALV